MFQTGINPDNQWLRLFNTGFTQPAFVWKADEDVTPDSNSASPKRDADQSLETLCPPQMKKVCTASIELPLLPFQGALSSEQFQRELSALRVQRLEGQLSVGAMIERLSRFARPFEEANYGGSEITIRLAPGLFQQLRITREEHCSNCFPQLKGKQTNYIEIAEYSGVEEAAFDTQPLLLSMRADDEGSGEWMWVNAGAQTRGTVSKQMAAALSRCLGLSKVHLADFAMVDATGMPGKFRVSLLNQLLYGPEARGFYGSEGFELQKPEPELVSRIEVSEGKYLPINPYYDEHDALINSLRNLQVRDIYNTLLDGDQQAKDRFKEIYEKRRPVGKRSSVRKTSRRLCELMLASKEAGAYDELSFFMLRIVEHGVHAERGSKTRALEEKVAKAWEAGYYDVLYQADFSKN